MGDDRSVGERLPLAALLSQLLVAFTIEFDNEFEHQMPHRTTRHGTTPGAGRVPWLVSMPMWVHCMRFVPDDGIAAGQLAPRARLGAESMQMIVKRMSGWWGYLVVEAGATPRPGRPGSARLVRPSDAGRQAQRVWEPLTGVIEDRWRDRFGGREIERLGTSLWEVVRQIDVEMPDYLPVGEARLDPRPVPLDAGPRSEQTLPALMSKVLLALALDFEHHSDLALGIYTAGGASRLGISANIMRVLDGRGVRVADIPVRTGVAKMTIDNWLGALEKHGYVEIGPDPAASRFKQARLTPRGRRSRDAYVRWTETVDVRLHDRYGPEPLRALQASLERFVVDPSAHALLWQGTEPHPGGWRAELRRPATLPHYPVVSYRGGYPDGS